MRNLERLLPIDPEWQFWGIQHIQRYIFASYRCRDKRVLDVACGCGYGSHILRNYGAEEVVGLDISSSAIEYAIDTYNIQGVNFITGDCLNPPENIGCFDVIVTLETIEHLKDPKAFIKSIKRFLNPKGILIISAPNALTHTKSKIPIENCYHLNEPTFDELSDWLSPDFATIQYFEQSPIYFGNCISFSPILLSKTIAALLKIENVIRVLFRKPQLPKYSQHPADDRLYYYTKILPLIPERKHLCDVFIFVCEKST